MLKFKQFLNEDSTIPRSIKQRFLALGFTYLGGGRDQQAFTEPGTGSVVKIFGTDKTNKLSPSQLMFKYWAEYCNDHADNPFLPKFSGWEEFDYEGHKYLRIHMEKLQKLPPKLAETIEDISNLASYPKKSDTIKHYYDIEKMIETGIVPDYLKSLVNKDAPDELTKLVMLLGGGKFGWFWNTLTELSKIGRDHHWGIDYHRGNFMHRNDGVPVIVDPWSI